MRWRRKWNQHEVINQTQGCGCVTGSFRPPVQCMERTVRPGQPPVVIGQSTGTSREDPLVWALTAAGSSFSCSSNHHKTANTFLLLSLKECMRSSQYVSCSGTLQISQLIKLGMVGQRCCSKGLHPFGSSQPVARNNSGMHNYIQLHYQPHPPSSMQSPNTRELIFRIIHCVQMTENTLLQITIKQQMHLYFKGSLPTGTHLSADTGVSSNFWVCTCLSLKFSHKNYRLV